MESKDMGGQNYSGDEFTGNTVFHSPLRVFLFALPFWSAFVTLSSLSAVMRGYVYWWTNIPLDIALVIYAAAVSTLVYFVLRRAVGMSFPRQVAIAGLIVVVIAFPFEIGFNLLRTLVSPFQEAPAFQAFLSVRSIMFGGLFWVVPWSLWCAAALAYLHNEQSVVRERQLFFAEREAHEAQLRALRYQVNPHFLYNTLGAVSTLILAGHGPAAEQMVMNLSAFFRASLSNDPLLDVPLADEIELQRLYLEIERSRFLDSLNVDFDIPEDLQSALVPSLILQPLVENSIKHGMHEPGRATTIRVAARSAQDKLAIEIWDDGPGSTTSGGTGVGLGNVRRRLATRFGQDWTFAAAPRPEGGFQARLELPLTFAS